MDADVPWDDLDEDIIPTVKILNRVGIKTAASCQGGPGHSSKQPWILIREAQAVTIDGARTLVAKALIEAGITGFTINQEYMYQKDYLIRWKEFLRVEFWKLEPHA